MRINARLDEESERMLRALREMTGDSVSAIVRDAIVRYFQSEKASNEAQRSSYEIFKEMGLIGSFDGPEDLSSNYKEYLLEGLEEKHGYR